MKLTDIRNSINEISAINGLKMVVKGNTKEVEGIKLSKEMAQAMIDWFNSSPYGRKYPKAAKARLHISLGIMMSFGLERYAKHKGAKEELKYIKGLSKRTKESVVNEDDNPCWKNYQMVGMKKKNGKDVPNCVPEGLKEGVMSDIHLTIKSSSSEEDFIKKFFKKYGKQVKPNKESILWVKDLYSDVKNESVVNEAKYDIGMARKGNGITIYNKAEEEKGDYKNVAHIDSKGKVKYFDKKIPSNIKKQIEAEAKKMMEITKEETMKLTDLLNEDVYVKNKKTGNTYQVKNANPSKHEPPSKSDIEKAKSDAKDEPNRNPSKEEPKTDTSDDSPKDKVAAQKERVSNLVDGNFDSNTTGQDHADMLAKDINTMGGEDAEKAIKQLLDKNNFDDSGSELKSIKSNLERKSYRAGMFERKLNKAEDSGDEDAQMEYSDKLNDELAGLGEMLDGLAGNSDFSMANEEEYGEKNESSKRKIKESKGNMKLKDLLKESFEGMKVQSNPFHTPFVKENEDEGREESKEMNNEQKQAFLEAVKSYKTFGESIYRKEGLSKVYESIRNLVESAGKNMVKETEGSFDGITVSRHVKRMNESFKIFEKTLREVGTLQQRLESSYDEIGETLGKYYEINELEEGNEFGANRAKAIANGDSEFSVDGKTYPVKSVDKKDKDNAKEFTKESKGNMKLKDLLNESFGFGELPSSKLMKMKVSAKDMLASVKNKKVNESEEVEEEKINEGGFATWEMSFADMTLSGVKLSKKKVYKVKARNTVEAIKKAAKMAGVGDSWIATQTHSLKKIG